MFCSLNKPLVPGSFAAWGRTFSQKSDFFLNKPLVPGSFAAWGRFFLRNRTCLGTSHLPWAAALPGTELVFFKNPTSFRTSHLSQAASLPGAELFLRNRTLLNKPLVLGSFTACGRTFSQKSDFFERATCPGQLRCLGQNYFSKSRLL